MRNVQPPQLQIMPMTKVVRILLVTTVSIWFVGNVVIEQYFLKEPKLTLWLSMTPFAVIKDYFLWQPVTYLFIHDVNPLHIIFNMLLLWWLGAELERQWGSKFFTAYYFICGVGAALLYCLVALLYSIGTGKIDVLITPVVGASAAIFGLMVAYGMVFGERVVYFMFFFPMKAKVFVWILAAIEVVMVLNSGFGQGKVANLAHLGGIVTGFMFLKLWPYIKGGGRGSGSGLFKKNKAKNLKLVVNNTDFSRDDKPKYWH